MTDNTMRERIAEALWDHDMARAGMGAGWNTLAPGALRDLYLARADAVLTVLADLPDTAVEAGAKALYEKEREASPVGKHWKDWDPGTTWSEEWRDRFRDSHAAIIAAIKEGKA
ncbi:MAG: hypothetical protein LBE25_13605 [Arthrobacter sp.]|jgi:hypothetical protein|nr:hypothetical protein [Arthrobacter sp.]